MSTSISDIRKRDIGIVDGAAGGVGFGEIRNGLERVAQFGRRDAGAALELEQIFAVGPALAFLADAVGDGHAHVVEEHLVDFVVAADGQDRPCRDARALHVDQDEADAVLLASVSLVRTSANMRLA